MTLWSILTPVLIFIGLGVLAGLLLSVFSKIFAVPSDEKVEEVRAVLPGLTAACAVFPAAIIMRTALCMKVRVRTAVSRAATIRQRKSARYWELMQRT